MITTRLKRLFTKNITDNILRVKVQLTYLEVKIMNLITYERCYLVS